MTRLIPLLIAASLLVGCGASERTYSLTHPTGASAQAHIRGTDGQAGKLTLTFNPDTGAFEFYVDGLSQADRIIESNIEAMKTAREGMGLVEAAIGAAK